MTDTQELCGAKTSRGYNQTTAHGRAFYALDPQPEEVFIDDIAAQLSRVCRFGGALKVSQCVDRGQVIKNIETYSVAQHSVLVADNVPEPYRLRALLHDAAEAYIGDVIKPIKEALTPDYDTVYVTLRDALGERLGHDPLTQRAYEIFRTQAPDFSRIDRNVQAAILKRFGLPLEDDEADHYIKIADYRAVLTEHRDLQIDNGSVDWGVPKHPPFDERVVPLMPSAARALFLQRFNELYKGE